MYEITGLTTEIFFDYQVGVADKKIKKKQKKKRLWKQSDFILPSLPHY